MRISIDESAVTVRLALWEQLTAVRWSPLLLPISQITGVRPGHPSHGWRELRIPGTYLPGLIKAGTYRWTGRKEFWLQRWREPTLTITMAEGAPYTAVVLSTADADAWVTRISAALDEGTAHPT